MNALLVFVNSIRLIQVPAFSLEGFAATFEIRAVKSL